jgi:glycosyltransferase involved in cell wall biosynthesis
MTARPRIVYLVTEDWVFVSHRLPIARAARDAGFDVVVATRVAKHGAEIEAEGFTLVPLPWTRRSRDPFRELAALARLVTLYRRLKPTIVHHVAVKPALIGSLAAWIAGVPNVVNAITGLGYVFSSATPRARLLRPFVRRGFQTLLKRGTNRIIVQNPDDGAVLVRECAIEPERITLIRGSGVDLDRFAETPEPASSTVQATLASRMIWDKGIGDLVEAARLLKTSGAPVTVILAGKPDLDNPASIPESRLRAWHDEGIVEWRGFVADMPGLWAESHIAVLPSFYGEGVPKCLIEAAASGRPIVAADGPGLREIVRDGETGILVPPRDPAALADAIARLARDPAARKAMGAAGRRLAEAGFGDRRVAAETIALYRAFAHGAPSSPEPVAP